MRKYLRIFGCTAAILAVSGCSQSPPGPVTTDEDEIAAYNAMINDPANLGEDPEFSEEEEGQ